MFEVTIGLNVKDQEKAKLLGIKNEVDNIGRALDDMGTRSNIKDALGFAKDTFEFLLDAADNLDTLGDKARLSASDIRHLKQSADDLRSSFGAAQSEIGVWGTALLEIAKPAVDALTASLKLLRSAKDEDAAGGRGQVPASLQDDEQPPKNILDSPEAMQSWRESQEYHKRRAADDAEINAKYTVTAEKNAADEAKRQKERALDEMAFAYKQGQTKIAATKAWTNEIKEFNAEIAADQKAKAEEGLAFDEWVHNREKELARYATDLKIENIRRVAEARRDDAAKQKALWDADARGVAKAKVDAQNKQNAETAKYAGIMNDIGHSIQSTLVAGLADALFRAKSLKDVFSDMGPIIAEMVFVKGLGALLDLGFGALTGVATGGIAPAAKAGAGLVAAGASAIGGMSSGLSAGGVGTGASGLTVVIENGGLQTEAQLEANVMKKLLPILKKYRVLR